MPYLQRFAADIFTEGLMLLARSINPSAPTLFHAALSPRAKAYKPPRGAPRPPTPTEKIDTTPKKLEWNLTPTLRAGVRYAETRISDLICQNDCQALEFKGYGKNFITSHGMSPDAFVQMAFQAAWFGLYGRTDCVYEPAMTKAFLHGRTEAIRSVQPESVDFTKVCTSSLGSMYRLLIPDSSDLLFRCYSCAESRRFEEGLRTPRQANKRVRTRSRSR